MGKVYLVRPENVLRKSKNKEADASKTLLAITDSHGIDIK